MRIYRKLSIIGYEVLHYVWEFFNTKFSLLSFNFFSRTITDGSESNHNNAPGRS